MVIQAIKLQDDSTGVQFQVFKCEKCEKWFIYFHGKLRDLEDLVKNLKIKEVDNKNE
jgi:hypothetical protein